MGRIRRWFRGTFRPDAIETESVETESVNTDSSTTDSLTVRAGNFGAFQYSNRSIIDGCQPHPSGNNPILTGADVTDDSVTQFADPVAGVYDDTVYLFGESFTDGTDGNIAYATSNSGLEFSDATTILDESFHLSLPQWFEWEDTMYLVPSSAGSNGEKNLLIYEFDSFPDSPTLVENTSLPNDIGEYIVFPFNETWWLISDPRGTLYYSDTYPSLTGGSWTEHPEGIQFPPDTDVASPPIVTENAVHIPVEPSLSIATVSFATFEELTETTAEFSIGKPVLPNIDDNITTRVASHSLSTVELDNQIFVYTDARDSSDNYRTFVDTPTDGIDQLIELGATSTTTITDQATGGWQTVTVDVLNELFGTLENFAADFNKFNIGSPSLPDRLAFYASVGLTSVSGSPFSAQLRIRDTNNNQTLAESGKIHVDQDSDVTIKLPLSPESLSEQGNFRGASLEIWQDSGGSIDTVGSPDKTFYGAKSV